MNRTIIPILLCLASTRAAATSYRPIEVVELMSLSDVIVRAHLIDVTLTADEKSAKFRAEEVVRGGIDRQFSVDLQGVEQQTLPTSPATRYLLFLKLNRDRKYILTSPVVGALPIHYTATDKELGTSIGTGRSISVKDQSGEKTKMFMSDVVPIEDWARCHLLPPKELLVDVNAIPIPWSATPIAVKVLAVRALIDWLKQQGVAPNREETKQLKPPDLQ